MNSFNRDIGEIRVFEQLSTKTLKSSWGPSSADGKCISQGGFNLFDDIYLPSRSAGYIKERKVEGSNPRGPAVKKIPDYFICVLSINKNDHSTWIIWLDHGFLLLKTNWQRGF